MKKQCEENWEQGLREEDEGLFQSSSNLSDTQIYRTFLLKHKKKMKWQSFLLFRWF